MTTGEIEAAGSAATGVRRLSAQARAGLDVARASAALYVVLHHVVGTLQVPPVIDLAFSFGQEAVLVFFLLSGFVIFANEQGRVARPGGYYLRRLRRIYPLVIIAMLVSFLLWLVGGIQHELSAFSALGTLLSLQDISALKPGVISNPFLGNDPMWSLSYEVFFYAVFPLVMVGWRWSARITRHAVGAIAVLAYVSYLVVPNHFSLVIAYFLLWWVGAMLAKTYLDGSLRALSLIPEIAWLSALIGVAVVGMAMVGSAGLGVFPTLMVRHFAFAALLALIFLTPFRTLLARASGAFARPAALIAASSYGLYVLHYPLLIQTGVSTTVWFIPALLGTIVLAYLSDAVLARYLPRAPRT